MFPLKRKPNLDRCSTFEIKMYRAATAPGKKTSVEHEDADLAELMPMSAKEVQKKILSAEDTTEMLCNLFLMKSLQPKVDPVYYQILEVHGLVQFNEQLLLRKFLKENVQHSQVFLNRIIRYMSMECYEKSNMKDIVMWLEFFKAKQDVEWNTAFLHTTGDNDIEVQLLTTMIILMPRQAVKHGSKALSLMVKNKKLPECFELFAKSLFHNTKHDTLNKEDVNNMVNKFFKKCYDAAVPLTAENDTKTEVTKAQANFIEATHSIANDAFTIIQASDKNAVRNLLADPSAVMDRPSDLLLEFFLQFVKLGMFTVWDDKLIAWNYYYDDRWCGFNRNDLFGDKFELSECFHYHESFKYVGPIERHPNHHNLMVFARTVKWILEDDKLYETLMAKYGDEHFIQYASLSLSFAGFFDEMCDFYKRVKDKTKSRAAFLNVHIGYLYSLAKKGSAMEAFPIWVTILDKAKCWKYTRTINFSQKSFELPSFVNIYYTAQFASRLMRICLWMAAVEEGSEGWKKYGLIIAAFCETLEDTFLNHNMLRIMFQKASVDDLKYFFQPGFKEAIVNRKTYNHIMSIVHRKNPKLLESLEKDGVEFPRPDHFPTEVSAPRSLAVYNKLKNKDKIFDNIMLPESVYVIYTEPGPKAKVPISKSLRARQSFNTGSLRREVKPKAAQKRSLRLEDSDDDDRQYLVKNPKPTLSFAEQNPTYALMRAIDASLPKRNGIARKKSSTSSIPTVGSKRNGVPEKHVVNNNTATVNEKPEDAVKNLNDDLRMDCETVDNMQKGQTSTQHVAQQEETSSQKEEPVVQEAETSQSNEPEDSVVEANGNAVGSVEENGAEVPMEMNAADIVVKEEPLELVPDDPVI